MTDNESPCLIETGQGLSLCFHERFLYSRRNPKKNIEQLVTALEILPQTIVVAISPALGYGVQTLLDKLPYGTLVLAVEAEQSLADITEQHLSPAALNDPRFLFFRYSGIKKAMELLLAHPLWPFRRCIKIDFSAGAIFHQDVYNSLVFYIDDLISSWWKNRLTMIRLGRNYYKNLFVNLGKQELRTLASWPCITKPVVIAGSGPSLTSAIPMIKKQRADITLIVVDTALYILLENKITPDAVVIMESQFWIEYAFIHTVNTGIPVWADISARGAAAERTGGHVYYFSSLFERGNLVNRLDQQRLLPMPIPPLGSVGVAAAYLALEKRKQGVPVLCCGLDFSFSQGFTHATGAMATWILPTDRFTPVNCPPPSILAGVETINGSMHTNPALYSYMQLFKAFISEAKDLYIHAHTPLDLGAPRISDEHWSKIVSTFTPNGFATIQTETSNHNSREHFLEKEKENLERILEICSGCTGTAGSTEELLELIEKADYLYASFPDGHLGPRADQDFLNRIRASAAFFLKTINLSAILGFKHSEKGRLG